MRVHRIVEAAKLGTAAGCGLPLDGAPKEEPFMRSRLFFAGDVILEHATNIEFQIWRGQGKTIGLSYKISGQLQSPFDDEDDPAGGDTLLEDPSETALQLLTALLREGGAS